MASCFVHPAVAATGTCDACGKPVCMRCTKGTLDGFMCPPCAHRRYGRRKLIVGLKVAAIAAVVIAVAVGGLMVVGRGNRTSKPPVPKVRDPDPTVAALLDSRDLAPCDRKLVRQLADALSKLDRYAEVVEHGNAFFAKCGPFPRLEWTVVHALQQLGRYAEAVKHSTVIIEDNPFDSDFWWWRGEDLVRSKQHAAALADYRQSFANAQGPEAARFPAGRILDAADPAGRPCEGVFALRYFVEVQGGDLSGSLERRAAGLAASAGCDDKAGRGTATWSPSADDATIRVDVTSGAATGRFIVDARTGTTAVSQDFAARAGLAGGGPAGATVAANVLKAGTLTTAALVVGPTSADDVDVLVVDALPTGVDGVLGLSYLWRFQGLELGDAITVGAVEP